MIKNSDGQQRPSVQPGRAAPLYLSYLLRLWRSGSAEQWRGSLQSTRPGDPHVFADINKLFAFLREQLQQPAADRPQPGDFLARPHGEEPGEETGEGPEGGER